MITINSNSNSKNNSSNSNSRGNHLSSTTCLKQMICLKVMNNAENCDESCSKLQIAS